MERIESQFYGMIRDESKDPFTLKENSEFNLVYKDHWDSKVYTNKLGFREEVTKGGTLFLGDSFTVSIRTDYEDTFLGILDDELKRNVSNIAVGGWSTLEERKALKKYFDYYSPDEVVLVLYLQNDVWENYGRKTKNIFRRGRYRSLLAFLSCLPLGRTFIENVFERKPGLRDFLESRGLVEDKSQFCVYEKEYDEEIEDAWNLTKEEILEIKDFLEKKNVDLKLLSMTSPWQVSEKWREERRLFDVFGPDQSKFSSLENYNFSKPDKIMKDFSDKHDIEFHSLMERENELDSSFFFPSVDHWNKKGHRFVADYIKENLL